MKNGGKSLKAIFGGVLAVLIFSALLPAASAANTPETSWREPVKVGYFDLGSYYTVLEDGTVDSYDAAFLNEIARNTGLTFEYVDCKTWNQALEMLEAHEIDLLGTMQWTEAREASYEICDTSYGYIVAELAAPGDSTLIYEDYQRIDHATVGCIEGYVVVEQLSELERKENLSFDLVTYQNQSALDAALESGEIDMVAANAHAIHEDWKVVEKFAYAPFYLASWKGNAELTDMISEAIIQIYIHQPSFDDNLIKAYFPQMVSAPYSKKEYDVIHADEHYTIYFDGTAEPLVWYDAGAEEMKGVLVKICRQLEELTGLHFDIERRTEDAGPQGDTAVSYHTLYYDTAYNTETEDGVTNSILDQNFELYHRVGDGYEIGGAYQVGVVVNRDGLLQFLADHYPTCTAVEYETPEDCLMALKRGEISLVFMNTNVAEHFMITEDLDQIAAIPASSVTFGIALQFHGENAGVLAEIVNKGCQLIDDSLINGDMVEYALGTAPRITLLYLIKQHVKLAVFVAVVFVLIVLSCAVLFTYARVMRRQSSQVERANQARTDFFARMSHDLRTPMNGILGMIELTQQAGTLEEVRANMDKAKDSGDYMLSLINDTLDLQRLENGRLQFNPQTVQISEFVDGVVDMVRVSAAQKNITLELDAEGIQKDGYITIDPIRVKQIFINILSNAVKFTPEGGAISIKMEELSRTGNMVHSKIAIRDTGIGMSAEFVRNSLYKPYSQEQNEVTGQSAGSGLGLAITKNLVQLMGGRIEVESEPGEGTEFTVYLSFEYAERERVKENKKLLTEKQTQIQTKLEGARVLVCEDHPLYAEIA